MREIKRDSVCFEELQTVNTAENVVNSLIHRRN